MCSGEGGGRQRGKVSCNQACASTISGDVHLLKGGIPRGPGHPPLQEAGRLPSAPRAHGSPQLRPPPQAPSSSTSLGTTGAGGGEKARSDNRGELEVKKIEDVQKRAKKGYNEAMSEFGEMKQKNMCEG